MPTLFFLTKRGDTSAGPFLLARWHELSATAGTLPPTLSRAEAAMLIYVSLPPNSQNP